MKLNLKNKYHRFSSFFDEIKKDTNPKILIIKNQKKVSDISLIFLRILLLIQSIFIDIHIYLYIFVIIIDQVEVVDNKALEKQETYWQNKLICYNSERAQRSL